MTNIAKIRYIVLIIVLALGGRYFYLKSDQLSQLLDLTLKQISIALIAIIFSKLIICGKLKILFNALKVNLTTKEWLGLPHVSGFGNLIFFKSGTIAVAYYFKKKHALSYSKFVVGMGTYKLIDLFAVGFMGFILLNLGFLNYPNTHLYIACSFCFLLLLLIFYFFFPSMKEPGPKSYFLKEIYKIIRIWHDFRENKSAIILLFSLELVGILVLGLRYFIAFKIVDNPISVQECVVISIFVSILGFVSIVPGNIGIRETVVGLSSYYMNYSFEYGVFASTFDRILSTLWAIIVGFLFFQLLHWKNYSGKSSEVSLSINAKI